ncbi:MAG: hypothetical protein U1D69_14320, partial [Polynucleobacter sp.]|nr:hypothetical protein [Polynucleobacter sp.]
MSENFVFRFSESLVKDRSNLAIFVASRIGLDAISKAIKQDVTENLVPKTVYLISLENCSITLEDCKNDFSFTSEFDSYVGEIDSYLICLIVNRNGSLTDCAGENIDEARRSKILNGGMLDLFRKHSGLVVS